MANLKEEYTDIKNVTHRVRHMLAPAGDDTKREWAMEELFAVLAKPERRASA